MSLLEIGSVFIVALVVNTGSISYNVINILIRWLRNKLTATGQPRTNNLNPGCGPTNGSLVLESSQNPIAFYRKLVIIRLLDLIGYPLDSNTRDPLMGPQSRFCRLIGYRYAPVPVNWVSSLTCAYLIGSSPIRLVSLWDLFTWKIDDWICSIASLHGYLFQIICDVKEKIFKQHLKFK